MQPVTAKQPVRTVPEPPPAKQPGLIGSDFQTFLKMLTAQIRNQDPLNPMEGSDFAVQLATFSGVEQQVQTNTLLKQISESAGGDLADYASWVGKQVRTTGPVQFDGSPLLMDLSAKSQSERRVLVIINSDGKRVATDDVSNADGLVRWQGSQADEKPLPEGQYRFVLEEHDRGELVSKTDVPVYSMVHEVRLKAGAISLVLQGGARAELPQIDGLAITPEL